MAADYVHAEGAQGGKFHVYLSGPAVTPIFKLGLMKRKDSTGTDYFRGKTIRVTGQVEALEETGRKGRRLPDHRDRVAQP